MARLTRDQMLMLMTHVVSFRGTCNRLRVGAILTKENRTVSIGYNGAPAGMPHCGNDCGTDKSCFNTIHAEANALEWAEKVHGEEMLIGTTLYVTHSPCPDCAERIHRCKVARVVYDAEYRITDSIEWLQNKGVFVDQCDVKTALTVSFTSILTAFVSGE